MSFTNSNKCKEPILDSVPFLTKKFQPPKNKQHLPQDVKSAHQNCLAKYFPKYCQKLKIKSKFINWRVLNKIKQVKILHHLEIDKFIDDNSNKTYQILIKLLQNKRKHLKSIPIVQGRRLRECSIFLPRIKILDLSEKWRYGWSQEDSLQMLQG